MKKRIILAGGTGFLGQCIIKDFADKETEFVVLTRKPLQPHGNVRYVYWNGKKVNGWEKELDGAYAVINLAGRTVNCRYNEKNKKEIIDSRVDSTNAIGVAISRCPNPPKVWINAGSSAIFGDSGDALMTEESSISEASKDFSTQVCILWEEAFNDIIAPLTRKVFLRIALVLGRDGGVLEPFINLAKFGLCGPQGSGKQYISWLHHHDFARIVEEALYNENIEGIYNCSAPYAETNKDFAKTLRSVMHMPIGLPAPAFAVKIGAFFMGTEAELVLKGRRVMPEKLLKQGFKFNYPKLKEALEEVMK